MCLTLKERRQQVSRRKKLIHGLHCCCLLAILQHTIFFVNPMQQGTKLRCLEFHVQAAFFAKPLVSHKFSAVFNNILCTLPFPPQAISMEVVNTMRELMTLNPLYSEMFRTMLSLSEWV